MKKILTKSSVFLVVVLLSVLLAVPGIVHAEEEIVITPDYGNIWSIGRTINFTATSEGVDITEAADAVWEIDDDSIASNDGKGAFTAKARGTTQVTVEYEGKTGEAVLGVYPPTIRYTENGIGLPGETTYFELFAYDCEDLEYIFEIDGPTSYSSSGTIPSLSWWSNHNPILLAGAYTATFTVGGEVQDTQEFSVFGYESSLDVTVGYAGETSTFTIKATNSSGRVAFFRVMDVDNSYYSIYEETIPIDSDNWSHTISQVLVQGHYYTDFWIDYTHWGGSKEFNVVKRGVPKPPVEEKAAPEEAAPEAAAPKEDRPSGPAINERPISDYDKTISGFVSLFYNKLLRRDPEKEGLDAWTERLTSGALTGADLVSQFIFGEECQKTISDYSNEEFVKFLYKAMFNREPEADGFNAWLSRMEASMTREEVVSGFIHSLEFEPICKYFGVKPYPGYTETDK